MFNPRQYGVAQGSLLAKSIHQEDLQCNESSVNKRRKPLPPKVASANAFSRGRGGRGVGRGGRGLARGMNSHRGGAAGNFVSSRVFHKSLSQIPNQPPPNSSSAPIMMSNDVTRPTASGITYNASASSSHPRHFPSQPQARKGKAARRAAQDENPRPAKRRKLDNTFDTFEQRHRTDSSINLGAPDTMQGTRFLPGGDLLTRPMRPGDAISTPVAAKSVKPPTTSLITPSRKDANPPASSLIPPPHGNSASSQQRFDRFPPHIPTQIAIPTIKNNPSTISLEQPPAMKHEEEFSQSKRLGPAGTQSTLPPKLDTKAPSRTFATSPALPPAVKVVSSYQPPQVPKVQSNNINAPPPYISSTHASSSSASSAMPRLSSMYPPPYATQAMMWQYEVPLCPKPKSKKPASTTSLSLVPRSSNTRPVPSDPANLVKTEVLPPLPAPKKSPDPSPLAPVKTENLGPSVADDHRVSAEVEDPIVIKQEPDPSEPIIPQRRLVTESCSFYPIPQNCRKSVPNYKDNRIEYFRKEYKRLREFGLTKQRVVFRDDGLAIEWTSPIPVWSDTLLPETSA